MEISPIDIGYYVIEERIRVVRECARIARGFCGGEVIAAAIYHAFPYEEPKRGSEAASPCSCRGSV